MRYDEQPIDFKPKSTDEFDIAVGNAIRLRRNELGLTQDSLAKKLGVSFQQIQKYEKGSNKVSLGRFIRMSVILKISPTDFIDNYISKTLDFKPDGTVISKVPEIFFKKEVHDLITAYSQIEDKNVKKSIVELMEKLSKTKE